jgi:hypothetical protein
VRDEEHIVQEKFPRAKAIFDAVGIDLDVAVADPTQIFQGRSTASACAGSSTSNRS